MNRAIRAVLTCGVVVLTSVGGLATAASASQGHHHYTAKHDKAKACVGGTWQAPTMLTSGTYRGLNVSGVCMVQPGAHITINGRVNIGVGATLFAMNSQTMRVNGNISVAKRGILALGCTAELGCDGSNNNPPSADTVNGNITAVGALALYLNGDTVNGNLTFRWGGAGPMCTDPNADSPTDALGHDLVVKDNTFRGSVSLRDWSGCWMGFIRNNVRGSVTIADNYANPANINNPTSATPVYQGLDSTEIVSNTISRNLTCVRNVPAAQVGDSHGATNHVRGHATGECASISTR